jgi:predicted SAM-dependent methyltransferase
METVLKLNLGCGEHHKDGYVNVDKYGNPDVLHDLETFPWPWEDNSVQEVQLNHVLEHLGESAVVYFRIIKELYRICKAGAKIYIAVPHPRHDDFLNDPTHVRVVTHDGLLLFSKSKNREWVDGGYANSPLGLYLDVDFEIESMNYVLDSVWAEKLNKKEITEEYINQAFRNFNNVVKEIRMVLKVVK